MGIVKSVGLCPGRNIIGPLILLIGSPQIALVLHSIIVHHDSSVYSFYSSFPESYATPRPFTKEASILLLVFFSLALGLTKLLPGGVCLGPPSPTGYRNTYHANGLLYWLSMNFLFFLALYLKLLRPGLLYDHYGEILSTLNLIAIGLCILLYFKGKYWPSSRDNGPSGSVIFDFFYGTELYPKVWGWDIKQMTNDRFGMMWWAFACMAFAAKQYEQYGYVTDSMMLNVSLQWIYLLKFFLWETGYFYSLDIQHDRGGFYICWGCLVWVPAVYTSSCMWLVANPITIGSGYAGFLFCIGALMIWLNYDADNQRRKFRSSEGREKVWGKEPLYIVALYVNKDGHKTRSLLLASGWWGLSRHFHYIPEVLAALIWSPPVHASSMIPYFYPVFLTLLLLDRSYRDDARCRHKYGEYWDQYMSIVPYKLIPYVL